METKIIKVFEICGKSINMRASVREMSQKLECGFKYLFDMRDVIWISRSAADELYNLTHGLTYDFGQIDLINMESDVRKMFDIVIAGRYSIRNHDELRGNEVRCKTMEEFKNALSALVNDNAPCIG